MANWLRYYIGSYFSNKQAKEAANRSFWNVILSLLLFLIILTSFYTISYEISYPTHYKNANEFKEFAHEVFKNENHSINLKKSDDDTIVAYLDGIQLDKAIDTFNNETDKNSFSKYDYNLIIDTRESDNIYTEFDIVATYNNEEITYDAYLNLSSSDQSNYTVSVNQKPVEVVLNETTLVDEISYLNSTETLKNEFDALDKTSELYYQNIHSLYLTNKYSDVITSSNLPTLKYYYSNHYLDTDDDGNLIYNKLLLITNSFTFISFVNDKNIGIYYVGYYTDFADDYELVNDRISSNISAIYDNVDSLFNALFSSASGIFIIQRLLTLFTSIPSMLIMLLIGALLMFLICKFSHQYYCQTFMQSFKIIFSFMFWATIITSLVSIVTSFLMDTATVMYFGYALLLFLIVGRALTLMIIEFIRYKKNPLYAEVDSNKKQEEKVNENDFKGNLDLSNVKSGTKVITNNNVSDDDEEHMEFM